MQSQKSLTSRANWQQKIILLQYMKANPQLAFGRASFLALGKQITSKTSWDEITEELNNCAGGAVKTSQQWKKTWLDWKKNCGNKTHKPRDKLDSELLEFLKIPKRQSNDNKTHENDETQSEEELDTILDLVNVESCDEESVSENKDDILIVDKNKKSPQHETIYKESPLKLREVLKIYEERQSRQEEILLEILETQKRIVKILDQRLPLK